MARPRKYRWNTHLFKYPKDEIEGNIVIKKVCKRCRKPLTKQQIYFKCEYCSYKCSNQAKAEKARGKPRKTLYRANEARKNRGFTEHSISLPDSW